MKPADCILFSGGARGAEAEFGACAETYGVEEVNFTFDGHDEARRRGVRVLNHEELQSGDISLEYVSKLMNRRYTQGVTIRKVLQTLWYQVNSGQEIYVIGTILADGTVRGGTGWGAEFAKLCNKPLHVFDQDKNAWFSWTGSDWHTVRPNATLVITHPHFTGTGTRKLEANGKRAIEELYAPLVPSVSEPPAAPAPAGNIGPEGRRHRRILGMMGMIAGTIALISLDRLDAAHAWRLATFPLWAVAALGFLQSRARTCVAFAAVGTCDMESARVLSADDARALKRRAVVIGLQAVVIGIVVAVATLALP